MASDDGIFCWKVRQSALFYDQQSVINLFEHVFCLSKTQRKIFLSIVTLLHEATADDNINGRKWILKQQKYIVFTILRLKTLNRCKILHLQNPARNICKMDDFFTLYQRRQTLNRCKKIVFQLPLRSKCDIVTLNDPCNVTSLHRSYTNRHWIHAKQHENV